MLRTMGKSTELGEHVKSKNVDLHKLRTFLGAILNNCGLQNRQFKQLYVNTNYLHVLALCQGLNEDRNKESPRHTIGHELETFRTPLFIPTVK